MPERRFIAALLRYAAGGASGTISEIANATGIPTGVSSGKVAPTIDYCRGMGLVTLPDKPSATKQPMLTPFGRIVFLEDPFLKLELTQWLAHLHLCSEHGGAEVWYQAFWQSAARLGPAFLRDDLENWLASVLGTKGGRIAGPLVSMYQKEASFSACKALIVEGRLLRRQEFPILAEYAWGYAAWILTAIEHPGLRGPLTIPQLESACGWRTLTGWSLTDAERVLVLLEREGVVTVDRHMDPWIISPRTSSADAWQRLYRDIL